jgi:chromosome segregation ATPase
MPPLNTGNHEIEASFHVDNKHEEGDDVPPSTTSSRKADIRNELCRLQVRCEDLEQDRNYHAVKASELQEILEAHLFDDVQDTLMKKSMQIAEASMGVDRGLHLHIRKLEAEINRMKTERETEQANMMDLSGIVRSLQSSCQESDEEEEEEVFLTPEKALDMTLKTYFLKVNAKRWL